MVPERLLVGGAAAVVLLAAVAAVAVPGAIAPDPDPVRPAALRIADVSIARGPVGGDVATLAVTTRVGHAGGPAENVSLLVRAESLESGLVETARTVEVGTLEGDREVAITANLTVAREGGYRIATAVFSDGERRAAATTAVRGVGTLQPEYARTPVGFHRFEGTDHPVVEYSVAQVADDRATLRVWTYLTNAGAESPGGLRLSVTARQADANVVADRAEATVGAIDPGRTVTPEVELTVPDGYNYFLDAVLWKDGVIVGSARSVANLDPTETISANVTRRDVGLEVADFERDDGGAGGAPRPTRTEAGGGQPGFGAAVAALALVAVALLGRRWSR